MNRMTGLRAIGVCVAALLLFAAGLGIYGKLVRSDFPAGDSFSSENVPDKAGLASHDVLARFSWDGDLLASYAAAKASGVLRNPPPIAVDKAIDIKSAQDAVVSALRVSPIRPALWLTLATLNGQSGEPVTPALRMSYLTGMVPFDVIYSRIVAVTSSAAAADEEIRLLARSDIRSALANRSRYEPLLVAAYVKAIPEGKSLLLELTRAIDPKFNEILRRY